MAETGGVLDTSEAGRFREGRGLLATESLKNFQKKQPTQPALKLISKTPVPTFGAFGCRVMMPQMTNQDQYSFDEASKLNDEFERLLRAHDVEIKKGSLLEMVALAVEEVLSKYHAPDSRNPETDIRELFRQATGATGLAHRIVRVANHKDFGQLVKHLKLLEATMPNQNLRTPITDGDNNKVFELLIASAAMVHGTEIELDDPNESTGRNPDIMATIQGIRWAFACKAAHTKNGKTIKESIEKGVQQIDRSDAQKGIVIVNVKNIVDHEEFWKLLNEEEWRNGAEPDFFAFESLGSLMQKIEITLRDIAQRIEGEGGGESLLQTLRNGKSVPAYGLFLSATTGILHNGKPTPIIVHVLKVFVPSTGKDIGLGAIALLADGLQHSPRCSAQ